MNNGYINPEDKVYFTPGDICILKLDISNKPKMIVVKIERSIINNENSNPYLRGVKCRWFTDNGFLQEAIFSTKDLLKLNNNDY